ncbi:DUF4173 domain-containing protein [uncultured Tateyamaria sp.]|uniref:DUF4153 domain-containing protein n=1 Tax=uncultured Tateyamaria sp. TaxID=455651 RepID=UPI002603FA0A|nr:DUF4173 domain-containing protein [uncultured Tateyamaria sp.]
MTEFTIRGVPNSIEHDAWWLASDATPDRLAPCQPDENTDGVGLTRRVVALGVLALVLLADVLFWDHSAGVSLVVFSAALSGAAIASLRPKFSVTKWGAVAAAWIACALPVVEYLQFTSVLVLLAGHLGLLIWCALQSRTVGPVLRNLVRLPYLMPIFSCLSGYDAVRSARMPAAVQSSREAVMAWVLPLCASSVFLLLFIGANPVLERWLDNATRIEVNAFDPSRVLFWAFVAFAVYPFVAFITLTKSFATETRCRLDRPRRSDRIINARSVTISLVLFNGMFLAQNTTDIAFLWGGAALPDGLSYARYAHQGAYPLMATSVLAGLFVLISRRFIPSAPLLKVLLLAWIVQNVFLVSSALARLELYVDVYGFTYLRVRAGIGMGLVAVGMGLLAWQLWFNLTNARVTIIFAGLCAVTVYAGCFVNFGYVIALKNLEGDAVRIDTRYLCSNAVLAMAALHEHARDTGHGYCKHIAEFGAIESEGWRDWGLRKDRLAAARADYLTLMQAGGVTSFDMPIITDQME